MTRVTIIDIYIPTSFVPESSSVKCWAMSLDAWSLVELIIVIKVPRGYCIVREGYMGGYKQIIGRQQVGRQADR